MKREFPSVKSTKKAFIRSALVQADRKLLEEQMSNDKSLSELLLKPAGELPEKNERKQDHYHRLGRWI